MRSTVAALVGLVGRLSGPGLGAREAEIIEAWRRTEELDRTNGPGVSFARDHV